jgi:hypothetical protein
LTQFPHLDKELRMCLSPWFLVNARGVCVGGGSGPLSPSCSFPRRPVSLPAVPALLQEVEGGWGLLCPPVPLLDVPVFDLPWSPGVFSDVTHCHLASPPRRGDTGSQCHKKGVGLPGGSLALTGARGLPHPAVPGGAGEVPGAGGVHESLGTRWLPSLPDVRDPQIRGKWAVKGLVGLRGGE